VRFYQGRMGMDDLLELLRRCTFFVPLAGTRCGASAINSFCSRNVSFGFVYRSSRVAEASASVRSAAYAAATDDIHAHNPALLPAEKLIGCRDINR